MKLIKFGVKSDYGNEVYLQLFSVKGYSLFQIAFGIDDQPEWIELPYISISMGFNKLFSLFFTVSKFSFCVDLLSSTWYLDT